MTCWRQHAWLLLWPAIAACAGDGSDIGPSLPRIPDASCKAVVLDDQGRGVVGAVVSIDTVGVRAITGRNGRGDFLANPRGRLLLRVDGRAGAATANDEFSQLTFASTIAGPDIATPLYLPALPASASATVALGTQTVATTITSAAGGQLVIANGSSVGASGSAALALKCVSANSLPTTCRAICRSRRRRPATRFCLVAVCSSIRPM